jgi:hypothetical protein
MKTATAVLFLLGFHAFLAEARIGETREQCVARYGAPVSRSNQPSHVASFFRSGFQIDVEFHNGKAESLAFAKSAEKARTGEQISETELKLLLEANAGGQEWEKMEVVSMDSQWATKDRTRVASYSPIRKVLFVATAECIRRGAEAKKSEEAKSLKGF